MTVAELIEELQQLPGDPSLRVVVVKVDVSRPYAGDVTSEGRLRDVGISFDVCYLRSSVYVE